MAQLWPLSPTELSSPPAIISAMPFDPYRRVLAVPGVRRLTLLGVVARIPHTAMGLVLTVHVTQTLGQGYAIAGLLVAALTVGMALGGPWRGRSVDRFGLRRALLPSVVGELVLWSAAPWLPLPWLLAAVVLAGVLGLPVFTILRLALSVMVPEAQRRAAFALDSVAVELSFMVGPALGVLVAIQVSTTVALVAIGVFEAVAGLALMAVNPPTASVQRPTPALAGAPPPEPPVPARQRIPVTGALVGVLGAAAGSTIVLAGTDVSVVATMRAGDHVAWTGLVLGIWAFASLLGGLVYGLLPRSIPPLVLLLVLGLLTAPVGLATTPVTLSLALLAAGFLCAPVVTATAEVVTSLVPESIRGEAMGWHGSALTSGVALGAPLAGAAIDHVGPWAGFSTVGVTGVLLAVLGLAAVRLRRQSRRGDPARGGEPDRDTVRATGPVSVSLRP